MFLGGVYLCSENGHGDHHFVVKLVHMEAGELLKWGMEIANVYRKEDDNIVRLMNIVQAENLDVYSRPYPSRSFCLVYEHISNNLTEFIKDLAIPPTYFIATKFLKHMLKAVSYLETIQCSHGRINPDNVMVTDDGVFKLGDFGIIEENGVVLPRYTVHAENKVRHRYTLNAKASFIVAKFSKETGPYFQGRQQRKKCWIRFGGLRIICLR